MLDMTKIRNDFPALQQKRNGEPPVYFDSACMSLKPQQVINAINEYYSTYSACAERSDHWFASATEEKVTQARQTIANYLNVATNETVFTHNTTEGINLLAFQFGRQDDNVVIVSDKEHNSNFLPWLRLQKERKISLEIIPTNSDTGMNLEQLEAMLKKYQDKTGSKLVSTFATSNLDGSSNNISAIAALTKKYGFWFHLDAAQALPHRQIHPVKENIDFLTFSGHKMLGPTSTGVFWGKEELLNMFEPLIIGGGSPFDVRYDQATLQKPPMRFEAGLQHYAGIIGFGAAIDYLVSLGENHSVIAVSNHDEELNRYTSEKLLNLSDKITILGSPDASKRSSILSFTVKGMDHHQVSYLLNEQANIMVRAGRHCVHGYCNDHNILGTTRVSFYLYNTREECDTFLEVMERIVSL